MARIKKYVDDVVDVSELADRKENVEMEETNIVKVMHTIIRDIWTGSGNRPMGSFTGTEVDVYLSEFLSHGYKLMSVINITSTPEYVRVMYVLVKE